MFNRSKKVTVKVEGVEANMLAYYIETGMLVHNIIRATVYEPNIDIRIWQGRVEAGVYSDSEMKQRNASEIISGVLNVEPVAEDWEFITRHLGSLQARAAFQRQPMRVPEVKVSPGRI